jgi:hypothetical protein
VTVDYTLDDDAPRAIVDGVESQVRMNRPRPQTFAELDALSAAARVLREQVAGLLEFAEKAFFAGGVPLGVPGCNFGQVELGRRSYSDRIPLGCRSQCFRAVR